MHHITSCPEKSELYTCGPGTIVQMAAEFFKHETVADLLVMPFRADSQ